MHCLTRERVVDKTFVWNSTNLSKGIVRIDASQLSHFSMYQAKSTGLYTKRKLDSESVKFKPRQNKTECFESMVMSYFQRVRPQCKEEIFYTSGKQKRIDAYSVDGFRRLCNNVFEAIGCYYHFCSNQEARLSLTEYYIQRSIRKRVLDQL